VRLLELDMRICHGILMHRSVGQHKDVWSDKSSSMCGRFDDIAAVEWSLRMRLRRVQISAGSSIDVRNDQKPSPLKNSTFRLEEA